MISCSVFCSGFLVWQRVTRGSSCVPFDQFPRLWKKEKWAPTSFIFDRRCKSRHQAELCLSPVSWDRSCSGWLETRTPQSMTSHAFLHSPTADLKPRDSISMVGVASVSSRNRIGNHSLLSPASPRLLRGRPAEYHRHHPSTHQPTI